MRLTRLLFLSALCAISAPFSRAVNVPPEIIQQPTVSAMRRGGTVRDINLATVFRDPDAATGSVVRFSIRIGEVVKPVYIECFDTQKPITTANFLSYVNSGRYQDNFFHRLASGFVLQGGGFRWTANNSPEAVTTFDPIQNEPGISNIRGTVAMAKLGGDPNSATSQWFVNLANNSANLDAQNGGFTVFGRVIGTGMTVIDEIAALPVVNAGGAFDTLPVKNFTGGSIERVHTIESNAQVVPSSEFALQFTVTSDDSALVAASLVGNTLRCSPASDRSGSTVVRVTATDLDGATASINIPVTVLRKSEGWHVETGNDGKLTFVYNPADTSLLPNDQYSFAWGDVFLNEASNNSFKIRNDSASAFSAMDVTRTGSTELSVTSGAANGTVATGQTVTFGASFTAIALGARSGRLRIGSADVDAPSLDILVSADVSQVPGPSIHGATGLTATVEANGELALPDFRGTTVTATDARGVTSFTQTPAPGTVVQAGSYEITFVATNSAGVESRVVAVVAVRFPAITSPALTVGSAYTNAATPAASGFPSGSVLTQFGQPAIGDLRTLAVKANVISGREKTLVVYREDGAGLGQIVAKKGGPASLGAGITFKSFLDPLLSPNGKITVQAKVDGATGANDEGVWTDIFGSFSPLIIEGSILPGNAGMRLKSVISLSVTNDSIIALVKLIREGTINATNDVLLLRVTSPSTSVRLARTGTPMLNSTISKLTVFQPSPASMGQGRWHNSTDTLATITLQDKRVFLLKINPAGVQTPMLRAIEADPVYPDKLAKLGVPSIGGSSVAILGIKAPKTGVSGAKDTVILRSGAGGAFAEVAAEGAAGGMFSVLSDPVANAQGDVLFSGSRRSTQPKGAPTNGLWLTDGSGSPELVAGVGGDATNADGGQISSQPAGVVWTKFITFALPDAAGPVFVAQMKGTGVSGKNKLGLWAVDSAGLVRLHLRTGDFVTLPTGAKELKSFSLLNASLGSIGARRSYNSSQSLAVLATFTDRSQAVLRVDIP